MNQREAKGKFRQLVCSFFPEISVRWAEATGVQPQLPYITLKAMDISRTVFSRTDDAENILYDCSFPIDLNLYTHGAPVLYEGVATGNFENTATSDLSDFAIFLESEGTVDLLSSWGMDISINGPVRDLTELKNETKYRYRAMAEFTVRYAQEANGLYGIADMPTAPNSSGGGTTEMKQAEIQSIEDFELEPRTE